ncbi:MAG: endonuclease MutS2 [Candidatus Onthomonas sp.]|nr:endonuclease MutS2 [Candidatus Onthomonas sp.]
MTELMEKSLITLEFPAVLALLAAQAVCDETKERIEKIRPSLDAREVALLLQETTAARNMMDIHGAPALTNLHPVAAALQRASLGGVLNTRELLQIASVLRTARNVASYSGVGEERTCIHSIFRSLSPNKYLEEKISGAILSEDEIADNASPELADIRRKIRVTSGKAREVLQRLISSSSAKYLQEAIVTIRANRFVVPVKAEYKGSIPGLVHDVSASGSTYFIEPMGAVKANNELRELLSKEEKEIQRILAMLSREAASFQEEILRDYDLLLALDLIFARGKLSYQMSGMEPKLVEDGSLIFRHARHPLLDPKKAVPVDLQLGVDFDTLVITGPNTGGKTVTLNTAGLLTLMAQCGMHLPVDDGSQVSVFQKVLADIGDEQSIEQSLSTFSSHITNIVQVLGEADEHSLLLFDELGAGTDPVEGAALAVAIIEEARSLGAKVAATTHYAELKLYAMTTERVENASCEFDVETLQPTYRLLIGIPGKSNAFAIARRLGLPEHVIEDAAGHIDRQNIQFEDALSQMERQRQELEQEKREAARLRRQIEEDSKAAAAHRKVLETEKAKLLDEARAEAQEILAEVRAVSNTVFHELDEMKKRQRKEQDWQSVNQQRSALRHRINEADEKFSTRSQVPEEEPETPPAKVGDTVELKKIGTRAQVLAVNKDGSLQLQAGILKISAKQSEVRVVDAPKHNAQKQMRRMVRRVQSQVRASGARPELDIRGMTGDEGVAMVDRFLDDAVLAHLTTVTIIHGKGTGALRQAVHQHLKTCKYVKSYRLGRYGEGETGVTIVELK